MTEEQKTLTTLAVEPIMLDKNEMAAGLVFEREIAAAQMAMQQASIGRNAFTGYLKAAKGVPADWEIRDWEVGFEPPEQR